MIERPEEVQRLVGSLSVSTWALAALQTAVEVGLLQAAVTEPQSLAALSQTTGVPPAVVAVLVDLLVTLGLVQSEADQVTAAPGLRLFLAGPAAETFAASLRSTTLQSQAMLAAARAGQLTAGWYHTDPETLQAQGVATAPLFRLFAQAIFPQLDGLEARLQAPTATFLDVGFGVGAIAPVMGQRYPYLHIVGLEPQALPRELAARTLAAAGLTDRVEVRPQPVEALTDQAAFDLVWLPQVFLPDAVFEQSLQTIGRALRPGGWLLTITGSQPGAEPAAAVSRLINVLVGGPVRFPVAAAERLTAAGFASVQVFPGPAGTPFTIIAGRRLN